jgi:hypothetical protein
VNTATYLRNCIMVMTPSIDIFASTQEVAAVTVPNHAKPCLHCSFNPSYILPLLYK